MKGKPLIAVLIIIFLVVYAYFGMDYMKQGKEHEALTSQITDVTQILEQIPKAPQDLEQRLAAAEARLSTAEHSFPTRVNSTQVINAILRLASDSKVKAIPLVTEPWSVETVGKHRYYVLRLNVAVEGSFSQLVSFTSKLENGKFETLIMENLSLTRVTEQPEGESASQGTIPITASLDLAIYTQSLTSD